jgi:hypothetical protein
MPKYIAVAAVVAMLVLTGAMGGVVTAHHAGASSLSANGFGPLPPPPARNGFGPLPPPPARNGFGPLPPPPAQAS